MGERREPGVGSVMVTGSESVGSSLQERTLVWGEGRRRGGEEDVGVGEEPPVWEEEDAVVWRGGRRGGEECPCTVVEGAATGQGGSGAARATRGSGEAHEQPVGARDGETREE